MNREEYLRRFGYDPTDWSRVDPRPQVTRFPVMIPPGFEPSDSDGDGVDLRWDRKRCPGQNPDDGYMPRIGGGFFAQRGKHLHAAVDIMAAEGAFVVSPVSGRVHETVTVNGAKRPGSGSSRKGGHYVFIVDDDGFEWYFSHLRDKPLVPPGGGVTAGELIGYVGRTGNAARRYGDGSIRGCPHLHLRVGKMLRPGIARKYDPLPLIQPFYDAGMWRVDRTVDTNASASRHCVCPTCGGEHVRPPG